MVHLSPPEFTFGWIRRLIMLIFCKREDIMSSQRQIELLWQPDKILREPDPSLTKKIIVFDRLIKLKIACFVI